MNDFFRGQYDYIYFFYGLSLLFLFIVCFGLDKGKPRRLPWFLLGLFGFVHGINEWLEIYIINAGGRRFTSLLHLLILGASYLLLFEFARRAMALIKGKAVVKGWIYAILLPLAMVGTSHGVNGLDASIRYFLGLPAALFSAWVIYETSREELRGRQALRVLSVVMVCYGLTTGLVVPKVDFALAKWLNFDSFYLALGFPVQLFRGVLALFLAMAIWHYAQGLPHEKYQPKKIIFPFKPTKWIIMFSLVALIGLGWVFTNYLDYYAGIQIIKNSKVDKDSPLNKLVAELSKLEKAAMAMSSSSWTLGAFVSPEPKNIAKAAYLLSRYRSKFDALNCALLDARGSLVTAVDSSDMDVSKDKSYVSLPYFKEAMRGKTGYYFTLGSTSNERVYYVSYPVKDKDAKILGAVVIKKSIPVKPVLQYRLLSIIITMFVCILAIIFFIVLRRKENLIELIEEANVQLQAADKMKTDFISIVSHELRTPLTSIKNAAAIMLKGGPDKRALDQTERELLEIIMTNTNRQTRMISDLLDVSKIEAGVMDIYSEPLDIVALARETSASLRPEAEEKNISLSVTSDREIIAAACDAEHTRRIFTNLIVNAIRFTPENGQVTVTLKDSGLQVTVAVSDTGIGIREEDKPRLFSKFYRAPGAYSRQRGGSGLGLVITKGLVEIQGGRIWFDSVSGRGSSFYFTLPRAENKHVKLETDTLLEAEKGGGMKKRILIIDDEPDILKTTKLALESEGYEVDTAESGEDGLSKLSHSRADLLLLDLRLPDKSGFQIAKEIKSKEEYKDIPIIALSGMSDVASKHIAAKADVLEYIEKPIDMERLKFHIADILGK